MKASAFLFAGLTILSITSANAAPAAATNPTSATKVSSVACSTSAGGYSAYPSGCRNGANFKSYVACKEAGKKNGWREEEVGWYCTGLGLH